MEGAISQIHSVRPPTIPVPRNRTRSGSSQPPNASPPLRSVADLRPSGTKAHVEASSSGNMDIGDRNVTFAPPTSEQRKETVGGGLDSQTPGGSKVPAFLNKLFR